MSAHPNRNDITIAPFEGHWPEIHDTAFIAPGCRIIGKVTIGREASIWYNCVVRGDANTITIGARSNIQDGSIVHCDSPRPASPDGYPTVIGEDVLIGHMTIIHGCTLESRAFVGMGAVVMDGCRVASDGMLAAGALLTPGKAIGPRELWGGRPARLMRELDDDAVAANRRGVAGYVQNARRHEGSLRR